MMVLCVVSVWAHLGCLVRDRVGDSAERDYPTDRLLGAQFWGGLRTVCKQRSGR